jgi:hypothetical protein
MQSHSQRPITVANTDGRAFPIDVASRIEGLDLTLFDAIKTQSVPADRRSWLAVQRALRRSGYVYLEIGSFRGGSLQQHVVDPQCRRMYSIDARLGSVSDARGAAVTYVASTAMMIANLERLGPTDRLVTFDCDARAVDHASISEPPTFCFIDGQHTNEAARSDFSFCLAVCDPHAAILFHDAPLLMPALSAIAADLHRRRVPFVTRKVYDAATFALFLRDCPAIHDPFFVECAEDGMRWLAREQWNVRAQRWLRRVHPIVSPLLLPFTRPVASWIARRFIRQP